MKQGGIFNAPNALGATETGIFRGRELPALGAVVPESCWDKPGFDKAHQDCFALSQQYGKMFASTDPSVDKSQLVSCTPGMTEKQCIDAAFDDCRAKAIKDFGCGGAAAVTGMFKDNSGNLDPLRIGLALFVSAIVLSQYKKASR